MKTRGLLMVSLADIAKLVGAAVSTAFFLFLWLAGPVAGVWLLILRDWRLVVSGLFFSLFMPYIYAFVCWPGIGLGMLGVRASEKGRVLTTSVLGLLSAAYDSAIVGICSSFGPATIPCFI